MTFPSSSAEPRGEGSRLLTLLWSSLLLLLLLSTVLLLRWRSSRRRHVSPDRLPPGDEGLPLLGETLRLISAYKSEDPEAFMDERVARHGRVFTSHVFGERTVFSSDPEVNRLVVQNEGKLFECSYPSSITTLLGRHALVLSKGPYHRRMHSLTVSSFSTQTALKDHLLPDIDRLVRLHLDSWADGQVLHLLDHAKKITFDLAVKQLLSIDPGERTEELRREYQHLIDGFFSLPIPFFSFTTYGRAIQARRRVAEALKSVFRQRISKIEKHKEEEEWRPKKREADMLGTLLAEGVRDEEQVVDYLLALLVAGYETTSTSMTLAVKFLSESPEALATLTEEQDSVRRKREEGSSGNHLPRLQELQWTDYKNSMPFTHCVINETLRIGNIISGVFRRAIADIPIPVGGGGGGGGGGRRGYTIPKGCKVFASFRAIHMDSEYYTDARTFNPWRWQQQQQPLQQQQQQHNLNVFMPFGGGARLCPGYELARVELAVFLHHLVTTFSWEAVGEDRLVFFPTTRTLKGYPIRVHRRCRSTA